MRTRFSLLAVAVGAAFLAQPASAAGDARCTDLPRQVKAALASADGKAAEAAARRLRTGESLCRASNARGAAREFQAALKLLGADDGAAAYAGK